MNIENETNITKYIYEIANTIPDAICFTDLEGIILHANYEFEKITNYSKNREQYIKEFISKEYKSEFIKNIKEKKDSKFISYLLSNNNKKIEVYVTILYKEKLNKIMFVFENMEVKRNIAECILEGIEVATWSWNIETDIAEFNDVWEDILGYDESFFKSLSVESWLEYIHEDDRKNIKIALQELFQNKEIHRKIKYRIKDKNGNWHSIEGYIQTIAWTMDKEPLEIFMACNDKTDSENLEKDIYHKKNFLKALLKTLQEGIIIVDDDYKIKYANNIAKELNENIIEGQKCYESIMGKDSHCIKCPSMKAIKSKKLEYGEYEINSDSGKKFLEIFSYPMKYKENSDDLGAIEFIKDVTERKQIENELLEYKKINESLISNMDLAMVSFRLGSNNNIVVSNVNDQFEKITGFKKNQVIDKNVDEILADSNDGVNIIENVFKTGKSYTKDTYLKPIDKWVKMYSYALDEKTVFCIISDINKQKEIEESLRESKEKYKFIVENGKDIFFEINDNQIISYISKSVREVLGYEPSEMIGNKYTKYIYKEDKDKIKCLKDGLLGGEKTTDFEYRIITKDKEIRWHNISIALKHSNNNSKPVFIGTTRDITEKKIAKLELDKQNRYLKTILDTTQEGFWIVDSNSNFKDANSAYLNMLGYSKKELLSLKVEDVEAGANDFSETSKSIDESDYVRFETKHKRKDGSVIEIEITVSVIKNKEKEYICFGRDISERKKQERIIKDKSARLEAIVQNSPLPIMIFDEDGRYVSISPAAEPMFDVEKDRVIGKTFHELLSKELADDFLETVHELNDDDNNNKDVIEKQDVVSNDKGETIYISRIFSINEKLNGKSLYASIVNDITQTVLMKDKVLNEKEQFRTTLLSVGDGIISTNNKGKIEIMNEVAETITGWSIEDAKGKQIEEVFQIYSRDNKFESKNIAYQVLEDSKRHEIEKNSILLSKDKKLIPIEDSASPIKDSNGEIQGVVIVFRDITEKKRQQDRIEYLSYHDQLTGLYNRRYMENKLNELDDRDYLPLVYIDLDINGLKMVNDAFGHEKGDTLIMNVADVLKEACSDVGIPGRMGGDEFSVIIPSGSIKEADETISKIKEGIKKVDLSPIIVSVAAGYSIKNNPYDDMDVVISVADENMYRDKLKTGRKMREETIKSIIEYLINNNPNVKKHLETIKEYTIKLAKELDFDDKRIENLAEIAYLHDVGMISVPLELYFKLNLSDTDRDKINRHSECGYQVLKAVDRYVPFAEFVLYHHERWDGEGYPEGLKGEEIPLESRILAIAEEYDMIKQNRWEEDIKQSKEDIIFQLNKCKGNKLDPKLVDLFVNNVL